MTKLNYEELEDEQLVELVQNGDEQSAETLIRRYKGFVVKQTRSFFLIGAEPEDLVQEGMIGLYKAILSYKTGKAKFITHAYSCVKSSIIDAIKRANRDKHKPLNEYEPLLGKEEGARGGNVINIVEIEDLLERAKEMLSSKEKEVFSRYIQGFNTKEIAEELNTSAKSIDNSIQRIKKKIASLMEG